MSLKPSEYELTQEVTHVCPECQKKWKKRYMVCARPKRMKYCAECRALLFPATPPTPTPAPGSADAHRADDYKLRQAGDE